jgi:hypothetical protein
MLTPKRVIIATICGVIFGFVCLGFALSNPDGSESLTCPIKWSIVIGRTLLGFMIGISALRMPWWLHGIVLGIIASIPMAIPIIDNMTIAISTVVMGMIYGFLIELVTSVLFKARPVGMIRGEGRR